LAKKLDIIEALLKVAVLKCDQIDDREKIGPMFGKYSQNSCQVKKLAKCLNQSFV
jgi:hypothetical protein